MHQLPVIPPLQLEPIEIDSSLLTFKCYSWAIPKSTIEIPIICFDGCIEKETHLHDLYFIQWRCGELLELINDWNAIVIDFRNLEIEEHINIEQVLSVIRRQNIVRIIVNPKNSKKLHGKLNQDEVSDKYEETFWKLATVFNKKNQDLEILNLKFTPVSLEISDIQFEGYTWKLGTDEKCSGYVKFIGKYRDGSLGKEDAKFIDFKLEEFCDYVKPTRLVIDLKDLDYQWSDDLGLYPSQFSKMGSPIFFLLESNQRKAYKNSIYEADIANDFSGLAKRLSLVNIQGCFILMESLIW
jgi:hypothetical protein